MKKWFEGYFVAITVPGQPGDGGQVKHVEGGLVFYSPFPLPNEIWCQTIDPKHTIFHSTVAGAENDLSLHYEEEDERVEEEDASLSAS